jgi:hypothetical protein
MAEQTFDIYTDDHVAHVGPDHYRFEPEVATPKVLQALAEMAAKRRKRTAEAKANDPDLTQIELLALDSEAATADLREFLTRFMVPESIELFAGKVYQDKVLVGMHNFLLETYGIRPTGSSSGSAEPSATTPSPGDDSTVPSPSEE